MEDPRPGRKPKQAGDSETGANDYWRIKNYIRSNPKLWDKDRFNENRPLAVICSSGVLCL